MEIPIILAHGALGNFDEVIFFSVGGIFAIVMGISWVKSRMTELDFDDDLDDPEKAKRSEIETDVDDDNERSDHFRLD